MRILNILVEITLYSSAIFAAILLLKLCFGRRMSPWLHYALWGVLIARLMIPVTLESSVHLLVIPAAPQYEGAEEPNPTPDPDPVAAFNINPSGAVAQPQMDGESRQARVAEAPAAAPAARRPSALTVQQIIPVLWLTGAGMGLGYLVILYCLLLRRIRSSAEPPSQRLLELLNEVKAQLNIKGKIRILCQYGYGTPAMMFPRTVLMPIDTLLCMNDEQLKLVLRHELMHYKRGDTVVGLVLSFLNAVYWFNPMVWIAFRQIRADMETACDSAVVRSATSHEKSAYAAIILSLFSKKQYGNLVLGMVQGDTRKIAEKRIRGVFMEQKTGKKVRAAAVLLTSMLLFTCFTTACQPTPENEIVQSKNDGTFQQAITNASSAPSDQGLDFGTPQRMSEEFQNASGKLTVRVDAPVEVPETNALPVVEVTPRVFTQQDADAMAEALFQGKPLLPTRVNGGKGDGMTQQEIKDTIVTLGALMAQLESCDRASEEGKKLLERFGLNPKTASDEDVQTEIQSLQDEIDAYKQQLKGAPDDPVMQEPSTVLADLGGGRVGIEVSCELGNAGVARLDMYTYDGRSRAEFTSGIPCNYLPTLLMPGQGMNEPDISQADARAMADAFVAALYPGNDLMMSACGLFARDDTDISDDSAAPIDFNTAPKAYAFEYLRAVAGVPCTYTIQECSSLLSMEDNVTNPLAYERIEVVADSTGIVSAQWHSPMRVGRTLVENVALLSFEQVQEIFRNMIKVKYSFVDEVNEAYTVNSADVTVTRVTLGYTRIASKDNPDEFMMVPVWDFFGYLTQHIEGRPDDGENWDSLAEVSSLLTINAVDGTVIDRGFGY